MQGLKCLAGPPPSRGGRLEFGQFGSVGIDRAIVRHRKPPLQERTLI